MADKKTGDPEEFHVQHDEGSPMRPVPQGTAKAVREQHEKETAEFAKIKDVLEEYGAIMQACIEEAERTIKIWRGRVDVSVHDEVVLAMMPAVSVALFEKVTRKAGLRDDMKLFIQQTAMKLIVSIYAKHMDKILAGIKLESKEEGVEP